MIEPLWMHGVHLEDLVPPLVEMKEVVNPEWSSMHTGDSSIHEDLAIPKYIMLNMQFTLLTVLFLVLIANSAYNSRSPSLLFGIGSHLSHSWWKVVRFEVRIVQAIDTGEGVGGTGGDTEGGLQKSEGAVADQVGHLHNWHITLLGGRLVIGFAGLLAPVIGVGLRTAFSTIRLTGVLMCLSGSAGAAVIAARITGKGTSSPRLFLYLNCTRSLSCNIPPMPLFILLPNRGTRNTHKVCDVVD
ncbi:hypothetical protein C8J55DRAFT_592081 [Lentinula edodes]|uniref:Uncharacterized protein n=1 Tax=Lentinula lateritia TaxID=40482 RepID=A0A9W8ZQ18_9AGAR|nr:hypothetical protein C8J55DRAFT_592081 [Lentinula edodes]